MFYHFQIIGLAQETQYFIPSVEIKDYDYDSWTKNNIRTYNNILKIMTGQGDDYTTGCLLFYSYCNEHYKMI